MSNAAAVSNCSRAEFSSVVNAGRDTFVSLTASLPWEHGVEQDTAEPM